MNLLLALVIAFQTNVDPLLSRFVGQWSGTGTVLNYWPTGKWKSSTA